MQTVRSVGVIVLSALAVSACFGPIDPTPAENPLVAPTMSLASGQHEGPQLLTLSSPTEGATIIYTKWVDDVLVAEDVEYTEPIDVDGLVYVRAHAEFDGEMTDAVLGEYLTRQPGYSNQVFNGDFEQGTLGWELWVNQSEASATWTTGDFDSDGDDELAVTVSAGGSRSWHVQAVFRIGFPTVEGDLFQLSYETWSDPTGPHNFAPHNIGIDENGIDQDGDGDVWESYFWQEDVSPEASMAIEKRVPIFHRPAHNHPRTRLVINLGSLDVEGVTSQGTIYFDDIVLERVPNPESFDSIVTTPSMRAALMPMIWEARDTNAGDARFDGIAESQATAYHLAAIDDVGMSNDSFEDKGYQADDFDLSTITNFTYFGRLNRFFFDDLPVVNTDIERIGELTRVHSVEVNNTDGDNDSFPTPITDISPLANLRRLKSLVLLENPIPVTEYTSTISPDTFPSLEGLRIGLSAITPSSAQTGDLSDMFGAFGDEGHVFYEVELSQTGGGLTDTQFLAIYDRLISNDRERLENLNVSGGGLTNGVVDEMGTLLGLYNLDISENLAIDAIAPLAPLTDLWSLSLEWIPSLSEFGVLNSFTSLNGLEVNGTGFDSSDWSTLAGLTDLEELEIRDTAAIASIDQILATTGLFDSGGHLELGDITLSEFEAIEGAIVNLQDAGITVEYEVQ